MTHQELLKELKNFSVLFVEDEQFSRKASYLILKDLFKTIKTAKDGEEALEILKKEKFDLLITDIIMPKINGFEVIDFVKHHSPKTICFILSAYFDTSNLLEAIRVDVDGFLVKPFNVDIFLHSINKVLSQKLRLEEEINLLEQYKEIVDESLIVSKTDLKGNIIYINDEFEKISGFKREELIGKNHNIVRHPDVKDEVFRDLWNTILNKKTWKGIIKNRKKNGETYYVDSIVKPILDKDGNIKEFIALRKDITNYVSADKLINDKLKILSKNALLILVKIDNYSDIKLIYEEELLIKLKQRLLKRIKNLLKNYYNDIEEYWIKEDIFGFLILDFDEENVHDNIQDVLDQVDNYPILIDGFEYYPLIKISYAYKTDIYNNAMIGIETAKLEDKIIYADGLVEKRKEKIIKNIEMLKTLEHAIENDKIISLFQPIISNETLKPVKYESLVRIIDDEGKLISPYLFLDIAKKAGIYHHITKKVIENSFKVAKEKNISISINLSPSDILQSMIRKYIIELLKEYHFPKGIITFELLEDEIIHYPKRIQNFISEVRKLNADIAIDDFGEGYSNFTRIADLQADWIKIDGILIKDIHNDTTRQNIVQAIVEFAKKENKKTVAEFVENEEIFKTLQKLEVDYFQGYYFSKPLPIDKI